MPGLSQKDLSALLDHIEPQGVEITRTKKGYMLRLPDGKSTMVHMTESDHRGPANLRATLKRSGIIWPTEQVNNSLPTYVTKGNMHAETLQTYRELVGDLQRTTPLAIARLRNEQLGSAHPDITTSMRALYRLGFRPEAGTGKKVGNDWILAAAVIQPTTGTVPEQSQDSPVTQAEAIVAEAASEAAGEYPEIDQATALVASRPELKPVPEPKPFVREIIDTAESWTLDAKYVRGQTAEQIFAAMKAAGLDVEIRVWHHRE